MSSEYEEASPGIPLWFKVGLVIVAAIAVWLAVGLLWSTLRLALAFAGYVIVAFLAYQIGKWVGRNSGPEEP
jgi:predicted lysophospholipase L1 biosynthesis ABC-type transport system permease subunit